MAIANQKLALPTVFSPAAMIPVNSMLWKRSGVRATRRHIPSVPDVSISAFDKF